MIALNGTPVQITMFPDGTSQCWKLDKDLLLYTNYARITWQFSHEGEFLHLAQLKHLLDHEGFKCDLILPYLPYGRQDKNVSNDATFALSTFANLINALEFGQVKITDPHSHIALEMINNSIAIYPIEQLEAVMKATESTMVCYPDKGAASKYPDVDQANYPYHYIYGEKVRDQLTGNITSYQLVGDPTDKNVLIVDDICDGGMTFKILAKDLLANGAKEVNLFVTHGIFSKGLRTLFDSGIKRIFTQDGEKSERSLTIQI